MPFKKGFDPNRNTGGRPTLEEEREKKRLEREGVKEKKGQIVKKLSKKELAKMKKADIQDALFAAMSPKEWAAELVQLIETSRGTTKLNALRLFAEYSLPKPKEEAKQIELKVDIPVTRFVDPDVETIEIE